MKQEEAQLEAELKDAMAPKIVKAKQDYRAKGEAEEGFNAKQHMQKMVDVRKALKHASDDGDDAKVEPCILLVKAITQRFCICAGGSIEARGGETGT